jgi:hypothetical protein
MLTLDDLATRTSDNELHRRVFELWLGVRGDRIVPKISQLHAADPNLIDRYCLIFESRSPEVYVFRHIAKNSYRRDIGGMLGKNFIDMAPEKDRCQRMENTWRLAQRPCAGLALHVTKRPDPIIPLEETSSLDLPVFDDDKNVMLILAAVYYTGRAHSQTYGIWQGDLPLSHKIEYYDIGAGTELVPFDQRIDLSKLGYG